MGESKKLMNRRSYEADFKSEILKLLFSGKKVKEISETFGIAENLLYRWKTVSMMQKKQTDKQSDKDVKLLAEIAKLKAENERLKTDRAILKKALGLLSMSD